LCGLDPDRLDVQVFFQLLQSGFASVAAHLVAAKRHGRIHGLIAVHPHRASANSLGQAVCFANVPCPNAASKAKWCRVGSADHFVDVLERDRGHDRTEDLILSYPHIVTYIGEYGRWHEVSLGKRPFGEPVTAGKRAGAFLLADLEVAGDALELLLRNQRPDLRLGVDSVADPQPIAELGHAIDEFVVDAPLDEKAGPGAADLAGIGEYRHPGAGHSGLEISVGEYYIGRLAAELERHALEIARRGLDDLLTGEMRA